MTELLTWLEASALGQSVRGAGVWSYAIINLVHIAGVATLFGSIVALDLRMLGLFRRAPLAIVALTTVPLGAAGFALAVGSGVCLLSTNATEYIGNPFLPLKFGAIFVGLLNMVLVHRSSAWQQRGTGLFSRRQRVQLAAGGGLSLVAWGTAITAGRMLGYW